MHTVFFYIYVKGHWLQVIFKLHGNGLCMSPNTIKTPSLYDVKNIIKLKPSTEFSEMSVISPESRQDSK